jgi:hypothetical protein
MKIYILACDVTGESIGCYRSPLVIPDEVDKLLEEQPFGLMCFDSHFWVEEYKVDSNEKPILYEMGEIRSWKYKKE